MRRIIITFLVCLSFNSIWQTFTKKDIAPLALTFVSGFCDGTAEALQFHYPQADAKFNLNDDYWNPNVSWKNKYENGNPDDGPAYFGSTTFLVWTTDAYHLSRTLRNATFVTGITLKIGERQKWWEYIIEAIGFYCSYTLGFNVAYEYFWK